ncbi:hypothetical protein SAMN05660642_02000 [Geodermatophilus siccatus]|uniref:Uncharacterized protein n=1 Tax=Geodermatophilus siccatus TaxID=1137991 RepID=A0A1G9RNF9_9ACTN|nr:hypothetical protein SAMN05660642_02000 [Geodermatophilus siccatus]
MPVAREQAVDTVRIGVAVRPADRSAPAALLEAAAQAPDTAEATGRDRVLAAVPAVRTGCTPPLRAAPASRSRCPAAEPGPDGRGPGR